MMLHHFTAAILALLLVFPAVAQSPDRSQPPAVGEAPILELPALQTHRLSNGIEVLFMEKDDVPLVQMNLIIRSGSVDDPSGMPGLAMLTAALVDEGAGDFSALELADAFEFLGARFSITPSYHNTVLALRVPAERFAEAAELLSDVVLRPHFDDDELERLRLERLTSLVRAHDEPSAVAETLFDRVLFGEEHPYGRPSFGNEAFLRNVTTEDIRGFYEDRYRPSQASVVLAGDVSPDVLASLEDALGSWSGTSTPSRSLVTVDQVEGMRIYLVDKPGAAQSVVQIGRLGVPRDTEDYHALSVLNTILGGSFTSRLNQNLREDKGYTYGARSSFDFRPFPGPFSAGASVFTDVTAPALQEFVNELEAIGEPLPEDEVRRAKNFLAMRYPQNFQSVSRIAGQLSDLAMYDLPDSYLTDYTQHVQSVTQAEVEAAADQYLDAENLVIVVVGDRGSVEESIRELDIAPVEILEVTDVLGAVPVLAETTGG